MSNIIDANLSLILDTRSIERSKQSLTILDLKIKLSEKVLTKSWTKYKKIRRL